MAANRRSGRAERTEAADTPLGAKVEVRPEQLLILLLVKPMQPGERITLIKKIAGRLATDDYEGVRLALRQFGLAIDWLGPDENTIDEFQSVVSAIEDAPDGTLLNLHDHLFGESAPSGPTHARALAEEIWTPHALRLFVSHTSKHKDQVGSLRDALAPHGVSAFVAHTDINPTRAWQEVIETALETCDALAAYMTDDFPNSLWTDQEIGFCVARAILIIPIKVGRDPYGFIGKYQAMQGYGKEARELATEIVGIVGAHPLTANRMVGPLVASFARSGSFESARQNLSRLLALPDSAWTPELVALVRTALTENGQLREAVAPKQLGSRPLPEIVGERLDRIEREELTDGTQQPSRSDSALPRPARANERRAELVFDFSGGYSGSDSRIEFGTRLTNDGTKIARGVVVRGFLDDEPVAEAGPVDVPLEAPPVIVNLALKRPEEADLSKALNDRPIFHGRRFTATAEVDGSTLRAEWPHDETEGA